MGIYKRKQESKKTNNKNSTKKAMKKKRKQELDQKSDQENDQEKKNFLFKSFKIYRTPCNLLLDKKILDIW